MKITMTENVTLVMCELEQTESAMLEKIALQRGVSPERALRDSISIFLNKGVQTPKRATA